MKMSLRVVALSEEMSAIQTEEDDPQNAMSTPVSTPEGEATAGTARESIAEKRPQSNFLVGRRCYIPLNLWWLLDRSSICGEV